MRKRTVGVVLTDKAQLSRLLPLMKELKRSSAFRLKVIVGAGALTYLYGNVLQELKRHGIKADVTIPTVIDGGAHGSHLAMAKTAALGMLEFATAFDNLGLDMIIVRGDRFEVLPIATAAAYLNKVLVHIEGGDMTGSIDESVRHAVTKLAHVHFVTNRRSYEHVIRMGESKRNVFNVGSLDIDFVSRLRLRKRLDNSLVNDHGVGEELDLSQPYLVVMYNPVTSETEQARRYTGHLLSAVHNSGTQALWIWPNIDAGSDAIAKKMREWQVKHMGQHQIRFIRYLGPEIFINILNNAAAIVGNSSTGIKESSWLGVPAVNIGSRQYARLRARNVFDCDHEKASIETAIVRQIKRKRYARSTLYGDGGTAKRIVKILREIDPVIQKNLSYRLLS